MEGIEGREIRIAVVGLGYVGLPLARLFSTKYEVVGFDKDPARVAELMAGRDHTGEVSEAALREALSRGFYCTGRLEEIQDCGVYIVAVPTPVDLNNRPDLQPLLNASESIGKVIQKGDVVIYESTVYPGVTEEECVPVIERVSGLRFNEEFFAGYSPERNNPGDKEHTVEKIRKVTSGSTPGTADFVDQLYNSVLTAGTYKASSIRVAEASKIVENVQRDVNIAFMNELSRIFNAMEIDTQEVLAAAGTKWNFIPMKPGLVGGHCIGVDPYYLIQKAQVYGVFPQVISAARRLNDGMGEYVANQVIRLMNKKGIPIKDARMLILGVTFKENCPDIRNTKVIDIYKTFQEYSDQVMIYDPVVRPGEIQEEYGIEVATSGIERFEGYFDAMVLAVAHEEFKALDLQKMGKDPCVLYDVKGVLDREMVDGRL